MKVGDKVGFHRSYAPMHYGDPKHEVVWYGTIKEVLSPTLVNVSFFDNVGERIFLVPIENLRPIGEKI